ncbi:diguanylate cyclase [Leptospira terpstrae]|uniref:diguanylate cyclase n=1 Tax=Leptospira terpstrae TaxID=293075 RepID=UPI003D0188DE
MIFFASPLLSNKVIFEKSNRNFFENAEFSYFLDLDTQFDWKDHILNKSKIPLQLNNGSNMNLGHVNRPIWIKIPYTVKDPNDRYILKLGFPTLSEVELKYKNENDIWISKSSGRKYPHTQWELNNRNIVFSLNNLRQDGELYLRIKTFSGLLISFSAFTETFFYQNDPTLLGIEFAFIGLLCGVAFYNFFLWIVIKDKVYILYSCYTISILIYISSMSGIAYQYIWPTSVDWNLYSNSVIVTSAGIFATLFTVNFLDSKGRSKKIRKLQYFIYSIWIVCSILFFSIEYGQYLECQKIAVLLNSICLLSMGILSLAKGFGPAKLYLVSWGIALSSISYYALLLLGFLPEDQFSHLIIKLGISTESIFLSIALASKVNGLQLSIEKNFQKYKEENTRLNKLREEFLANTSHEIKTPLHGMVGIAESILDGSIGKISPVIEMNIDLIHKSGKRLSLLVNDILDSTRLKHGVLKLNIKKVDLYQVSTHVISLLERSKNNSNIRIANLIPLDAPLLLCDENRIQQILFNILSNSIKFTDFGMISLSFSQELDSENAKISIHDTGRGINKADIQKIFERFDQLEIDECLKYQGNGLGLTITKQLVELQSGTIEIESEPGSGTTFSFTLPIAKVSSKADTEAVSNSNFKIREIEEHFEISEFVREKSSENKRILIVDDEDINIRLINNFLSRKNCEIDSAKNGKEALEKCDSKVYDLILLDVMMPIMSGYEVCRELRKRFNSSELKIILLTARNQSDDYAMGISAGANDFLSKPFDKSELFARIQNLLELNAATKSILAKEIQLKEATYLANTDELTGLRNRRSFLNSAQIEWEASLQKSVPVCLLMLDIDQFKSLNDNYGHEVGDLFLKKVAEVLHFSTRKKDIVGRYGGEEFIIFLPNTDFDTGILVAERIRKAMEKIEIQLENESPIKRTLSIGISHSNGEIEDFGKLIKHADDRLYLAKRKGRNRIQFLSGGLD